jgi:hypothetical protein
VGNSNIWPIVWHTTPHFFSSPNGSALCPTEKSLDGIVLRSMQQRCLFIWSYAFLLDQLLRLGSDTLVWHLQEKNMISLLPFSFTLRVWR